MPLAVERTTTFEVILGVGGEGDPWHYSEVPAYEVRRVTYRYSWEGSAELELNSDDREIAEAFGRRVVPELAD